MHVVSDAKILPLFVRHVENPLRSFREPPMLLPLLPPPLPSLDAPTGLHSPLVTMTLRVCSCATTASTTATCIAGHLPGTQPVLSLMWGNEEGGGLGGTRKKRETLGKERRRGERVVRGQLLQPSAPPTLLRPPGCSRYDVNRPLACSFLSGGAVLDTGFSRCRDGGMGKEDFYRGKTWESRLGWARVGVTAGDVD